jgi:hypothetical protein
VSQLLRSQSSFVPNGSSRCLWAPVAPLISTPVIGFAPQKVARARRFFRSARPDDASAAVRNARDELDVFRRAPSLRDATWRFSSRAVFS